MTRLLSLLKRIHAALEHYRWRQDLHKARGRMRKAEREGRKHGVDWTNDASAVLILESIGIMRGWMVKEGRTVLEVKSTHWRTP